MDTMVDRTTWSQLLGAFTQRNAGRLTRMEEDDLAFGAQVAESCLPLRGIAFDPRDGRVEIMLGDWGAGADHVTHTVAADEIDLLADGRGRDLAIRISHGSGQTILRLLY